MWNERMKYLIGEENVELLTKKRVVIFGVGGVGGFVVEALARSGVGKFDLISENANDSPVNGIRPAIRQIKKPCILHGFSILG